MLPVFTDCTGRIIGDVINKEIYNNNNIPALVNVGSSQECIQTRLKALTRSQEWIRCRNKILHLWRLKILISTLLQPMKAMSNHH